HTLPLHDALPIGLLDQLATGTVQGDAEHEAPAADGRDAGDVPQPVPEVAQQPLAELRGTLHQPISFHRFDDSQRGAAGQRVATEGGAVDRKSTRLNSSHVKISYAVFCLKKIVLLIFLWYYYLL